MPINDPNVTSDASVDPMSVLGNEPGNVLDNKPANVPYTTKTNRVAN